MKTSSQGRTGRVARCAFAVALTMAMGVFAGCASSSNAVEEDEGPIAATVGSAVVYESDVTAKVEAFRSANEGLDADEAWASWVVANGGSIDQVRLSTIGTFVEEILIENACAEQGIVVTEDDVETELEQEREAYARYGEGAWETVLAHLGYATEQDYASDLRITLMSERLKDVAVGTIEPTGEQVQAYVDELGSELDGRRFESLTFDSEAKARTALARISAGTATFEDVAAESGQSMEAEWDCLDGASDEISQAISGMLPGEVSDVLHTASGYEILRVVESYSYHDAPLIADMPESLASEVRDRCAEQLELDAWEAYGQQLYHDANVTISAAPSDLSYDVDLSLASSTEEGEDAGSPIDGSAASE